jgi:hypothetical protein
VLESVSARALLVAPIRLALGFAGLAASAVAAENADAALLAFVLGTFAMLVVILADPRTPLFRLKQEPPPPPPGARYARPLQTAADAVFPSTVAVALLTAVAAPFRPELGALLAGLLAGMGLAAGTSGAMLLIREREEGATLYVDRRTHEPYLGART